ncbi:MAG: hypothetical protein IIZ75_00430, partial [Lachnospiraceae bacterium]|nr:hypothetical protein [Lachnospiraceae bacterium]
GTIRGSFRFAQFAQQIGEGCAITGHNLWLEMGFAHRRRRFLMAKPVTITAQKAVNSNGRAS